MKIYRIVNKKNKKSYIGQTVSNSNKRLTMHKWMLNANKHSNPYLQNAWNKWGKENFEFVILQDNIDSLDDLNKLEDSYIIKYKTTDRKFGYNIRTGGNNYRAAEETKLKISKANKGHRHTTKLKNEWSKNKRIKEYPMIISPSGKAHVINNVKGLCKQYNLDSRNFRKVLRGKALHCKGWRLESTPIEMTNNKYINSISQRKLIYPKLLSPNGKIYEITETLNGFCKLHNLRSGHIRSVIKGIRNHHKGWTVYKGDV